MTRNEIMGKNAGFALLACVTGLLIEEKTVR